MASFFRIYRDKGPLRLKGIEATSLSVRLTNIKRKKEKNTHTMRLTGTMDTETNSPETDWFKATPSSRCLTGTQYMAVLLRMLINSAFTETVRHRDHAQRFSIYRNKTKKINTHLILCA